MGRADTAARARRDQADPDRARVTALRAAARAGDEEAARAVAEWQATRLAIKAARAAAKTDEIESREDP